MKQDYVFALDIGTRSVTGIILDKQQDSFTLIDYYMQEHHSRSMHDGQIHHVIEVSNVIRNVKETLEKKHGKIEKVCVAAAGRSLQTIKAKAAIKLDQKPITNDEIIKHLELSAVSQAQSHLSGNESLKTGMHYYCVGYSVLHYKLDNEPIGSLIDQTGNEASVDIIATFLPKVVVESLLAALSRANLEMDALTLEPIAAIHVLIPASMRRLNVAVVDVGAGTSDIAITDKGTVVAYGMVPIAGDEITEAISDHYLLDFPLAEQAKRSITIDGEAIITDILGFEETVTYDSVIKNIQKSIDKLASSIAEEIFRLNSKAPQAVMLIGGGSLTPELPSMLADKMKLPKNRVAIRNISAIQKLEKTDKLPNGPGYVTPIGIAIAAKQNPVHYVTIRVNEKVIRMFELKQLTIGDALIQAGIDINKWYGKPGLAYMVTFNGKKVTLPGSYGTAPELLLNNKPATVEMAIKNGDAITVMKGEDGKEPQITLGQFIGEVPIKQIYFQNNIFKLDGQLCINHIPVQEDVYIHDNDIITLKQEFTIEEFIRNVCPEAAVPHQPFYVNINGKELQIHAGKTHFFVNNKKVERKYILKDGDRLQINPAKKPIVKDLLHQINKQYWHTLTVHFNGKQVTLKQKQLRIFRSDTTELTESSILKRGDNISIQEQAPTPFIFQDIFRYVDINLHHVKGNYILLKNDLPSRFDDQLTEGDSLQIIWNHNH